MKTRWIMPMLSIVFLGLTFSLTTDVQAQVAKMREVVSLKVALKEMLQNKGAANLKKLTINVDDEKAAELQAAHQVESVGSYTLYQGIAADGKMMGTVMIINEAGKEGPLQVLVALQPDGSVYDVGFTIFGEDKGKSALNWNYLKQFIDKSSSDPIKVGDDVDGISGATWTSTSVAKAIKRATVIYTAFFPES